MNEYGMDYRDYRTSSRSSNRYNVESMNTREWKKRHTWKKNTFYW